jgi:hypothetical protein
MADPEIGMTDAGHHQDLPILTDTFQARILAVLRSQ